MTWYAKAAKQEQADAQYNLGWMYENKRGVQNRTEQPELNCKDDAACDEKAVTWFAKAAKQRHPEAMRDLAAMYRSGSGVTTVEDPALRCSDKGSCNAKAKTLEDALKAPPP